MNTRLKKFATMLTIIVVLLSYALVSMKITYSADTDGKIDLFTQKEPYSGKGPNVPSDAFGPEEVVILYALVTYGEVSLQNLLVTFCVQRPDNTSFTLTATTSTSGIATINFTIPTPQEHGNGSGFFGEWVTSASVLIGSNRFQDILTFKVDWIVKLISVRTIDENLTYRTSFGIEGDVGLEITLRNIAMCTRNVMLSVVMKDELNVVINHLEIRDYKAQPNKKLIFLYCKLFIPDLTYLGEVRVYVSALTAPIDEGGVAYCPRISTEYFVTPHGPLSLVFHDVAVVEAIPSATSIRLGQPLNVSVIVWNEGTEVESFSVSTYCDNLLIGTLEVTTLSPYSEESLNFMLDTSLIDEGNYTLTVSIPHIVNEADITDNYFVDGTVEVKYKPAIFVHDIAIIDINISKNSLYVGELLQINVTVINKGNGTETFDVRAYYDSTLIGTLQCSSFAPHALTTFTFEWNTSSVHEGFYEIGSSAPLEDDVNTSDNTFVYGVVQVKAEPAPPPPPPPTHDIAVLDVVPSSSLVYVGEVLSINVTLKNKGSEAESFTVILYYDSNVLGTFTVTNLTAETEYTHTYDWDTSGLTEGNYTLSAIAESVPGEENIGDNYFEDGTVTIAQKRARWFTPTWFFWFVLLLLLLAIILLIALLYRRKKRKEVEETFKSGWTAWYYCHDPQNRINKIRP